MVPVFETNFPQSLRVILFELEIELEIEDLLKSSKQKEITYQQTELNSLPIKN